MWHHLRSSSRAILASPLNSEKGTKRTSKKSPRGQPERGGPRGRRQRAKARRSPEERTFKWPAVKAKPSTKWKHGLRPSMRHHIEKSKTLAYGIVSEIEADISAPPRPEGEGPHLHPKPSTIHPQNATINDMAPLSTTKTKIITTSTHENCALYTSLTP